MAKLQNKIEDHYNKFGAKPIIIGMFWNNKSQLIKNIQKSIDSDKPYNEYELLTTSQRKDFDNGVLSF